MRLDYFLIVISDIKTTDHSFNSHFDYSDLLDTLELTYERNNRNSLTPKLINELIIEENISQNDISRNFSELNNSYNNIQEINFNEILKKNTNNEVVPFHDILFNNTDVLFNKTNDLQTNLQSSIQETTNIGEQSYEKQPDIFYQPLLDCNPPINIQSQEIEKKFDYNNSSNYNKERLINNISQDILSNEPTDNIIIQQEEKYENNSIQYSNLFNKRMLKDDINLKEETKSKKQKHEKINNLNIIENNKIEYSHNIIDKELIPFSCEEISEFYEKDKEINSYFKEISPYFEEISDSEKSNDSIKSLFIDTKKIERENNSNQEILLETNTSEFINTSYSSIQTTLINNFQQSYDEEMVNYYFIDFNNENTEIQPSLIAKKDLEKKLLVKINTKKQIEFSFFFHKVFLTWKFRTNQLISLILHFPENSSSIKIIKQEIFEEINIYNSKDLLYLHFSIKHTLFKADTFETLSKEKYLKMSIDSSLNEYKDLNIIGNGFIPKFIYENLKSYIVLKVSPEKNQREAFSNLLDLKFSIYNFMGIDEGKFILLYNIKQKLPSINEMSIKDYIYEFNEKKNSIKSSNYKLKYKSIDEMPIIKSPHLNCSPKIKFDQAIFLIKNFCVLFIKNINEVERILLDSEKNYITKNEEIKVIFNKIIPHLIPNWRIKLTRILNEYNYQQIKLISFFIFINQKVIEIMEKWD